MQPTNRSRLAFQPVFVGGAARSGTTLLHALICTSRDVNPYVGECSYLTGLAWSLTSALQHFDIHTRYYFDDLAAFEAYHADLLSTVLHQHWRSLGSPRVLALKDPNLTMLFPSLARWFPQARFVVSTRDPRDVVASRVKVQQRTAPGSNDRNFIDQVANDYNTVYGHLLASRAVFGDRLLMVSYEALVGRADVAEIGGFLGLSDLDASALWQRSRVDEKTYAGHAWNSPLYHQPITAEAVGSFSTVLDAASSAAVMARCGAVFTQLRSPAAGM
jgi:hypothetical protein